MAAPYPQATQTIARGDFEKVVLARATDLQFKHSVNPVALMAASRALNLNCYHFCMVFDASNAFLGSTPSACGVDAASCCARKRWQAPSPAIPMINRPNGWATG